MYTSKLERYSVTNNDRTNMPGEQLLRLREAMKVAKDRYEYLLFDIMAEDHQLDAVARDVIQAHSTYTRYRSAFAATPNC